jgi:hypothetical protein
MGKASSAKKVARAARAGGRVSSGQPRSLLFPGVLSLVVILGFALVIYARSDRRTDDLDGVPQLGDHIHQALSVWVCGQEFLTDVPEFESSIGIHTHGDGVIHIHPASQLGVGANATLGRYLKNIRDEGKIDFSLSDTKLTYLDKTYEEGKTKCEGVEDPQLRMAYWPKVGNAESEAEVTTGDFNDLRLTDNGGGITIYFGDPGAKIPKPPHAPDLARLGAADGGQPVEGEEGDVAEDGNTTTTAPGETTTTAAGDTTTTAPSEGSTTPAAP